MLNKMEIGDHVGRGEQNELSEKIETTLHRLQELKQSVSELKHKCEELRQMESEHQLLRHIDDRPICDKCGETIDPEQQVAFKDSKGLERSHYHRACFQKFFK